MSSRIEQFIRDNRDGFDEDEPSPSLWKKLEQRLQPGGDKRNFLTIGIIRWSAAASIMVLATLAVFYFLSQPQRKIPPATVEQTNDIINDINPAYAKEVYHFTQLIELRQTELKKIEREQPALYKEFIGDITTLDSSYNALKKELPQNPNREQLLEAMIDNLRLQTDLLNHQLLIIKKIKQAKKPGNENNSKSI